MKSTVYFENKIYNELRINYYYAVDNFLFSSRIYTQLLRPKDGQLIYYIFRSLTWPLWWKYCRKLSKPFSHTILVFIGEKFSTKAQILTFPATQNSANGSKDLFPKPLWKHTQFGNNFGGYALCFRQLAETLDPTHKFRNQFLEDTVFSGSSSGGGLGGIIDGIGNVVGGIGK